MGNLEILKGGLGDHAMNGMRNGVAWLFRPSSALGNARNFKRRFGRAPLYSGFTLSPPAWKESGAPPLLRVHPFAQKCRALDKRKCPCPEPLLHLLDGELPLEVTHVKSTFWLNLS